MHKKYVVSADILRLLSFEWAAKQGFSLPPASYFAMLRKKFAALFVRVFGGAFNFIGEDELAEGLRQQVHRCSLPIVSLDKAYFASNHSISLTRLVDESGKDQGMGERSGAYPFSKQIRDIAKLGTEIALLDDVLFTGNLMEYVIRELEIVGVRVPVVLAGVGVRDGVERVRRLNANVHCVREFESVIDVICERDFYPGTPFSGRTLAGQTMVGVPYLLPFGKMGHWATIPPEHQIHISTGCLALTVWLFEEIERQSKRIVMCQDLARQVLHLPTGSTSFVEALRRYLPRVPKIG